MVEAVNIVGEAVLRDYPLRLWLRQQEHSDAVLREFHLLIGGRQAGSDATPAAQLLELATMFTTRFGGLISALNDARHAALDAGLDRIDSRVPLPEGTPALLSQVSSVLHAVDEYCRAGDLLTLARSPELVALSEWSLSELTAQYEGADPTPWPGPF